MTDLSIRLDGIPVVANATERDARFPPASVRLHQRVHNLALGQIQRWNGTGWVMDFLAGNLATGAVAVRDEGVEIVPQAVAIDFRGAGVTATPEGAVARVTVPAVPVANPGGVVVPAPSLVRFQGNGVGVENVGGEAVVTIIAGGGMITVEDEGVSVVAPATHLDFRGTGVAVTNEGGGRARVTIQSAAAIRADVVTVTPPMFQGDTVEGTVAVGRTARLLRVTCDRFGWLRFYRTAAERTADTRTPAQIGQDPAGPVIWEGRFLTGVTTIDLDPDVWGSNKDHPAVGVWYYRFTRSDGAGDFTPVDNSVGDDLPPGASTVNLNTVTPTKPGLVGFTAYQYKGPNDQWRRWEHGGAFNINSSTMEETAVARTNVNVGNDQFRATVLIDRGHTDPNFAIPGCGFAWCVLDEAVGTWNGFDYLVVHAVRASVASVRVSVARIVGAGGGGEVVFGFVTGVALPLESSRRMVVRVQNLAVNVAWANADGTGETHILGPVTVPDLRTANRQRMGIWQAAWGGYDLAGRIMARRWWVEPDSNPNPSEPATVTSRVVTVEA